VKNSSKHTARKCLGTDQEVVWLFEATLGASNASDDVVVMEGIAVLFSVQVLVVFMWVGCVLVWCWWWR